jgi:hypothetical protein
MNNGIGGGIGVKKILRKVDGIELGFQQYRDG